MNHESVSDVVHEHPERHFHRVHVADVSVGEVFRFTADGPIYRVIRKFPGYNRTVWHVQCGQGDGIVKLYGDVPVCLSEPAAVVLREQIAMYRSQLLHHGVPTPMVQTEIHANPRNGGVLVFEFSPYHGPNMEEILEKTKEPEAALNDLRTLLRNIRRLVQGATDGILPVGIDMIPRNFCRDADGTTYYVDLMPPKIFLSDGTFLLETPEVKNEEVRRVGFFRHYTVLGTAQVLLVQFSRHLPEHYRSFRNEITAWLRRVAPHAHDAFMALPGNRFATSSARVDCDHALVDSWGFSEVYHLREAATILASQGRIPVAQLRRLFAPLTHFQSQPIEESALAEVRRILHLGLSKDPQ